jgi:cold-inducible RNA-binding protein
MAKKLYVGNLNYNVTNRDLEEMFAPYGAVETANVVTDHRTGRSKGFAFVEMSNDQEAKAAISGLHGRDFDGRSLTVNEARPREERPEPRGKGHSGGRHRY